MAHQTSRPSSAARGFTSRAAFFAVALAAALPLTLATGVDTALAQESGADAKPPRRARNPLDGQPAVRNRKLLVSGRFEVTPMFSTSVNADYKHTVGGGLKLEYHLNDSLSFGAFGVLGTSFNTGLTSRIADTLPEPPPDAGDPTPTQAEFEAIYPALAQITNPAILFPSISGRVVI